MSKYERFIIYPLLIVALFYGITDIQMATTAQDVMEELTVKEITVVNDDYEERVNISDSGIVVSLDFMSLDGDEEVNQHTSITSYGLTINSGSSIFHHETSIDSFGISIEDDLTSLGMSSNYISIFETVNTEDMDSLDEVMDASAESSRFVNIGLAGNKGMINLNNEHGDDLVFIGPSEEGDGLINVYDKYGDNWTSYGFKREH